MKPAFLKKLNLLWAKCMKETDLNRKLLINLATKSKFNSTGAKINYFTRHWQGDHSLVVSYWINNIIVGGFLLLLLRIYPEELVTDTLHDLYTYIAVYCIVLIVMIWQIVGVWKSANKHLQKSKRKFWAHAAKVFVVLLFICTSFMIKDLLPGLNKFIYIFAKERNIPQYSIRIMDNKNEIEITGGIKFGLTNSLRRICKKFPTIKIIHLNSFGGRVVEARRLREFIEEKELITSTNKGCFSACTIAYMGGISRFVYGDKKLGFHRYGLTDNQEQLLDEAVVQSFQEEKSLLLKKGASGEFIKHIYNTSPSDLWFPDNDVLLANKIITDIAVDEIFMLYQEKLTYSKDDKNKKSRDLSVYQEIKSDPSLAKKNI